MYVNFVIEQWYSAFKNLKFKHLQLKLGWFHGDYSKLVKMISSHPSFWNPFSSASGSFEYWYNAYPKPDLLWNIYPSLNWWVQLYADQTSVYPKFKTRELWLLTLHQSEYQRGIPKWTKDCPWQWWKEWHSVDREEEWSQHNLEGKFQERPSRKKRCSTINCTLSRKS